MRAYFTFVAMTLAIVGWGSPQAADYVNARYHFRFTPPSDWIQKDHPDALVVFMEPIVEHTSGRVAGETTKQFLERVNRKLKAAAVTSASFRSNITVTASKVLAGTTLEQYAEQSRSRIADTKRFKLLGEKMSRLGGIPALLRATRVHLEDGGTIQAREVLVVRGDSALSFTLASGAAAYTQESRDFDRSMATLRWTK